METKRWAYLLTGLMYPIQLVSSNTEPTLAEVRGEINLEHIGVVLRRVFITEKDRITRRTRYSSNDARVVFSIREGIRDDNFAQKFADAFMGALALAVDVVMEVAFTSICLGEDTIKQGRFIRIQDIGGDIGSELNFRVMNCMDVGSEVLDYVWHIVPCIVENESLMDASNFYRESIMRGWVTDDDVFVIMSDNSDTPASQEEMIYVETAYQNAFKAIEAVIGEPPKDERKLRMKLRKAGIDPDEMVGFELYGMKPGKETILKKVTEMYQARDKKTAHGKTGEPRNIGYCELKDKQALARYLISSHIETKSKQG